MSYKGIDCGCVCLFVCVFISGFCLLFDFCCFGFCPFLAQGSERWVKMQCPYLPASAELYAKQHTHRHAGRLTHTHFHFLESLCLILRPAPCLKSWDNYKSFNLMFSHALRVPAMTRKSDKRWRKFKHWIKIRTSQLAGDYSPIIISWRDSYFSKWSWEGPIVHQQRRGREIYSVWPRTTCSTICGVFLATQRCRTPAVFGRRCRKLQGIKIESECQVRSAKQGLPMSSMWDVNVWLHVRL